MYVNGNYFRWGMKQKLDENDSMRWTEISKCVAPKTTTTIMADHSVKLEKASCYKLSEWQKKTLLIMKNKLAP